MKAILYQRDAGAVLRDIPVPPIKEGEALIAVDACGLCGTDLMKLAQRPAHAVLGHEVAGRIARVGKGAKGLKEGDRVIVAHHVPCGKCHYCERESPSMCRQFKETNIDPGGFSEYLRASALHVKHTVLKIPNKLDSFQATQTEPLACCLRNVKRLRSREGDVVGLIGLGAIGLMTAQLLKARGVRVLGLDLDRDRAAALAPYGKGFTDAKELEAAIYKESAGRGLDALVLSAGPASSASDRLGWLREGGTLNIFASFHPSAAPIDLNMIYHRELTVISSYSPALEDLRESLDLIADGSFKVDALEPKTYALDRFAAAEGDVRARKTMKAIIVPK